MMFGGKREKFKSGRSKESCPLVRIKTIRIPAIIDVFIKRPVSRIVALGEIPGLAAVAQNGINPPVDPDAEFPVEQLFQCRFPCMTIIQIGITIPDVFFSELILFLR